MHIGSKESYRSRSGTTSIEFPQPGPFEVCSQRNPMTLNDIYHGRRPDSKMNCHHREIEFKAGLRAECDVRVSRWQKQTSVSAREEIFRAGFVAINPSFCRISSRSIHPATSVKPG